MKTCGTRGRVPRILHPDTRWCLLYPKERTAAHSVWAAGWVPEVDWMLWGRK